MIGRNSKAAFPYDCSPAPGHVVRHAVPSEAYFISYVCWAAAAATATIFNHATTVYQSAFKFVAMSDQSSWWFLGSVLSTTRADQSW